MNASYCQSGRKTEAPARKAVAADEKADEVTRCPMKPTSA